MPYITRTLSTTLLCWVIVSARADFSFTTFSKEVICDRQGRIEAKCMEQMEGTYRTLTECAVKCFQDGKCTGVSTDIDHACYHHRICLEPFSCGMGYSLYFYKKNITIQSITIDGTQTSIYSTTVDTINLSTNTVTPSSTAARTSRLPTTAEMSPPATTKKTSDITTTGTAATNENTPTKEVTTEMPTTTEVTTKMSITDTTEINKVCQQNATWLEQESRCSCTGGWVGRNCERMAEECSDLLDYGYPKGWPPHWVQLKAVGFDSPIRVRCHLFDDYFNMYIMINKGFGNFDKIWDDYVRGFLKDDYHFWLGLEKIDKFISVYGYKVVYLDTTFNYNSLDNFFQYRYENFAVDKNEDYKMNFENSSQKQTGPFNGTIQYESCLEDLKGTKFSTKDKDNDNSVKNCSAEAKVGWWFDECSSSGIKCNPMGRKYTEIPPEPETLEHIKMAGLNYRTGVYASTAAVTMYFNVRVK